MTKSIELTKGLVAIIDDDDYERVSAMKWFSSGKTTNYAMAYIKGSGRKGQKRVFLHRFIMNCPDDMQADHINGDRMDNRKQNLRITNSFGNNRNRGMSSRNTTGYKGVSYKHNGYEANICSKYLGRYKDAESAARAYDKAAIEMFGEFAKINFNQSWLDSVFHNARFVA